MKRVSIVPGKSTVNPTRMKPWRPKPRTPEEDDARDKVDERSEGWCEIAVEGVCQGLGREFQHRQAKGQLGAWTASNGLKVCGHGNVFGCHGYLHQHPIEAVAKGWTVESWDNPLTRPVLRRGLWVVLDDKGGKAPSRDPGVV
jgi:hypothetical protein